MNTTKVVFKLLPFLNLITLDVQDAFCDAHSEESTHAFFNIVNEYQYLGYLREQYFLIAGLQMGLELGNSSALFDR